MYFYFLLFYHKEEQTGAIVDPSSSNPYHMSIEEYFNPTTEQNTRGMCAYSLGGIYKNIQKQQNAGLEIATDMVASATNIFSLVT